jgi:hypothetical protein
MGGDSVIECVPENGRVNIYSSWTTAKPYTALRNNVVSGDSQKSIKIQKQTKFFFTDYYKIHSLKISCIYWMHRTKTE